MILRVNLPWLATLITRDPILIAMVAFATRLPWLLFSIPAGVWTDRADRRRMMVQADLVRLALTFGVVNLKFESDYKIFFSDDNPQLLAHEENQDRFVRSDNITLTDNHLVCSRLFSQPSAQCHGLLEL